MFLRIILFLLLMCSPVYGITVPLYGTYDFDQKQLTVFWNLPVTYDSYTIKVYRVVYAGCDIPEQQNLLNTYTAPVTSKSFNLTVEYKDTYNIEIFGIKGASSYRLAYQLFWVHAITAEFGVDWCLDDSTINKFVWTGYKLYQSNTPSFSFDTYETLEDWKKKTFEKTLDYGTKMNYILTSAAKVNNNSPTTESPPSAQLILYAVLPPKPAGITLEH